MKKLERSSAILEKIINSIKLKNYNWIPEYLLKTEQQISKDVILGKLPEELLEPPFSLNSNLKMIRDNLSSAIRIGNQKNLLETSEIEPYLAGAKKVIELVGNKKKIQNLTDSKYKSNIKYCITFISKLRLTQPYTNVMFIEGSTERDFWFKWEGDIEPVKIIYESKKIMVLYRVHWEHHFCEPYLDMQDRIQVFFIPYFHTPIIRTNSGILFAACVKAFRAKVNEYAYTLGLTSWFRNYYATKGWKREHLPEKYYEGWKHANLQISNP